MIWENIAISHAGWDEESSNKPYSQSRNQMELV